MLPFQRIEEGSGDVRLYSEFSSQIARSGSVLVVTPG